MLRLDLARLEREGRLEVTAEVPTDSALWEDTGLTFRAPLKVEMVATLAGSGEVVVRGRVRGPLEQQCRRCLRAVPAEVDEDLVLVFASVEELGPSEDDGEIRVLPERATHVELGEAIREEVILAADRFVVCDPECRGLCPRCGADLNTDPCDCTFEEPDPRWDALRALNHD
jgi:uncharacterized protein